MQQATYREHKCISINENKLNNDVKQEREKQSENENEVFSQLEGDHAFICLVSVVIVSPELG